MEEKEKDLINVRISKELVDILDSLKTKVDKVTWNSLNLSYAELSRILAKKIKQSNISY